MQRRSTGISGRPRILIVDGSPLSMELTAGLLEGAGYVAIEAWNTESAIRLARELCPDLILLEIALPGMDGISAAQRLKEDPETEHIPIIALTANGTNEDEQHTYEAGFDAYISKPICIRNFTREISAFLGRRLSRARAAQAAGQ